MEAFHQKKIIAVFVITCFVDLINSTCVVNQLIGDVPKFLYQCVRSGNYVNDVSKAPIDVTQVGFSISNIPTIQNGVFDRLSQNLSVLEICKSGVKEIEDNAFRGLTNLRQIRLNENELEVVMASWFRGLSNLENIGLNDNKIRTIEDGFFSTVSPLNRLDITFNKLTCISPSLLSQLRVEYIEYENNPWSWKCMSGIQDWISEKNIKYNRHSLDGWTLAQNVTKSCVTKSPEDESVDNCVATTLLQWLPDLPTYSVAELCAMSHANPSPFLLCG